MSLTHSSNFKPVSVPCVFEYASYKTDKYWPLVDKMTIARSKS